MLTKWTRLFKHRWQGDALRQNVPSDLLHRLTQAVQRSERQHSGEIRIVVEAGLPFSYIWRNDPLDNIIRDRALALFGKLRVWDTEHNNGVLLYLLLSERRIEIVADRGLNAQVDPETWQRLLESMRSAFQSGDFERGLLLAVQQVTTLLITHYPLCDGQHNRNELPDEPVMR